MTSYKFEYSFGGKFIEKKLPLFSSLNAVISTNESIEFITGHVIYKQVYTYKFQLKTTKLSLKLQNVWHSIHISWEKKPKNASFTCDDENNVSQSLKETTLRKSIR